MRNGPHPLRQTPLRRQLQLATPSPCSTPRPAKPSKPSAPPSIRNRLPGSTPNSLALSPGRAHALRRQRRQQQRRRVRRERARQKPLAGLHPGGLVSHLGARDAGRQTSARRQRQRTHFAANPRGPIPGVTASADPTVQYIARLFRGTLSIIDLPSREEIRAPARRLHRPGLSLQPAETRCHRLRLAPHRQPGSLRAGRARAPSNTASTSSRKTAPTTRSSATCPQGNGDPKLCLFPERVTPNHHKLAREFVLLDNFYADAEVSADGHEWSMGAYATDFVEKIWPLNYGHNRSRKFPYPAEGFFPIAAPAGGYLWDRAQSRGRHLPQLRRIRPQRSHARIARRLPASPACAATSTKVIADSI